MSKRIDNAVNQIMQMDERADELVRRAYIQGLLDGMREYAWWSDGVEYVGTCGQTYAGAAALILGGK